MFKCSFTIRNFLASSDLIFHPAQSGIQKLLIVLHRILMLSMVLQFITEIVQVTRPEFFSGLFPFAIDPQIPIRILLIFLVGNRYITMQQITRYSQIFMHRANPAKLPIPTDQTIPAQAVGYLAICCE
ncbi:hypothetical protein D3C76_1454810 [compost metagenome]